MNYLEIDHLSKIIKDKEVLKDINLSLHAGKIYGFFGSNGSGKTMLFRTICGLIKPTYGKIKINGEILHQDISFPRSVGVIIESPGFWDHLTGFENLKLLSKIKNIITDEDIKRSLQRVGLDSNDSRTYKKYSLGMKQRLAIAQAIMESPELLILDEPTNALDEDGIELIRKVLLEEKRRGATILIASHNKEDIHILSDQTFKMKDGQVFRIGEGKWLKMNKGIKILYIVTMCLLIGSIVFGILTKKSFTDNTIPLNLSKFKNASISINDEENITDKYFSNDINNLKELMNKSDLIVKGQISDVRKNYNQALKTKFKVNQIIKSDEKSKNITYIYVFEPSNFHFNNYVIVSGYNVMKENEEYLLFLKHLDVPDGYKYKHDEAITFIPVSTYYGKYQLSGNAATQKIEIDKVEELKYSDIENYEVVTENSEVLQTFNYLKKEVSKTFK